MKAAATVTPFRKSRSSEWTRERLADLSKQELANLHANAVRLGETDLATLCDEVLKDRPRRGPASSGAAGRTKGRNKLLPRSRAFGARGVWLQDARTSWSGIRKTDGAVVIALWQAAIETSDGACTCLLWAPNIDGSRPWSDTVGGRERLEHCKAAMERGSAEGLLVHGDALEGRLPEDRARSVLGIDAETVIQFRVELRDGQYWATWGKKAAKGAKVE